MPTSEDLDAIGVGFETFSKIHSFGRFRGKKAVAVMKIMKAQADAACKNYLSCKKQ
jgi:hypothetical protein